MKSSVSNTAGTDHDFLRFMEAFTSEVKLAVPCDGIKYSAPNMDQYFVSGVLDHYMCCFKIKVGDKSFGTIYFARRTEFLDAELTTLESMLAGLVIALGHLFQAEGSQMNLQDSIADGEKVTLSGAVWEQQVQG